MQGIEGLRETSLGVGRIFLNLEKAGRSLAMKVMLVVLQKYSEGLKYHWILLVLEELDLWLLMLWIM